ncbi:MAG: glycosyltransferase family 39 protein, partial [Chloroflexi bacterium]|nr:glycosyltransferase family 39 protein [Chloroflexota bacterium]
MRRLALLTSSLFIALYLITSLPRVFYSYDLDFIEDSMLMQSIRVANNQPVFVAPNAEFMPHVYMPLYTFIGGMLIKVMGASFALLRLLSLSATLVTAILIFVIAQGETQEKWIGFACAALFLGGYRLTGFWYELARVDSLFVLLLMIGMMIGLRARSVPQLLAAAAVMTLAFFTKQTAVLFAGALALYLFFNIRWRVLWFVIPFVALVSITILILNTITDGWFWYHTFTIAGGDPVE